jgi:gelsolin
VAKEDPAQTPAAAEPQADLDPFPRLIRFSGKGQAITASLVPCKNTSLNSNEVFLLDTGTKLIQWSGATSGIMLRNKCSSVVRVIDDERASGVKIEVHAEGDQDLNEFWQVLGGPVTPVKDPNATPGNAPVLFRLTDANGQVEFVQVAQGSGIKRTLLSSDDTFIFDVGFEIFVWEGKKSNKTEKAYARQYRDQYNRPAQIKITRCMEGGENEVFEAFLV